MKMTFVVLEIAQNGKYYALADTIRTGLNLVTYLQRWNNPPVCHLCESRREADKTAIAWNENYKQNGTFFYEGYTL